MSANGGGTDRSEEGRKASRGSRDAGAEPSRAAGGAPGETDEVRDADVRVTGLGETADAEERERLEGELAELQDRHLRLAAEFENYRKRTREELGRSGTRAQAVLVGSLLDSLDDLDRVIGMDLETATSDAVLEGIRLVEEKLMRALKDAGVELVEPTGEPFDPEFMEAVLREPASDAEEDDRVSLVLQKGVLFKGQLVRPARVAVRKLDG